MKSLLCKNLIYNTNKSTEEVIKKLKEKTRLSWYSPGYSEAEKDKKDPDFVGIIDENTFQIKANVSSNFARRDLFNPTLYGKVEGTNTSTQLSVEMKCGNVEIAFICIFFVISVIFSLIILNESNENPDLLYYVIPLPSIILLVVYTGLAFIEHLNFKDAKERLDDIILS